MKSPHSTRPTGLGSRLLMGALSLASALLLRAGEPAAPTGNTIRLVKSREVSLGQPIGQLRAVPVWTGATQPDLLLIYSEDEEIDPFVGMFFFPKGTTKLRLIDAQGGTKWTRDLGPGVVSGIWFLPVFPFDLDGDGTDEIWLVNNQDPAHPLNLRQYVLDCLDARTGRSIRQERWPAVDERQSLSHVFRNFILGGQVNGRPVLVTAQGTYGEMKLQGWDPGLKQRWAITVPANARGAKGSHMCAVVDLDFDGTDELLWGERCLSLATGEQRFCADEPNWKGHSDIVLPFLDRQSGRWLIHTCRESAGDSPPRVVVFDQSGKSVWSALEKGHIDTGWAARLGDDGRHVVLGVRVGKKTRTAEGETRTAVESFTYDGLTGRPHQLLFEPYTTIPVDLNGDGIHELVKGYFEGDGTVLDRHGRVLGNVGGLSAMASKFTAEPGEQILSYDKKRGAVMIWRDLNARDTPAALSRYSHPHYRTNQRLTACGYNLFNLGGI